MQRRSAIGVLCVLLVGCRAGSPAAIPSGPKSPTGWEVRYNAALALANRGSDKVQEPEVWDMLVEMLDESQQLRNFTTQLSDGREVPNETGARLAVIGALKAVQTLHERRPEMNLSRLEPSLDKLKESASPPVRVEADKTKLAVFGR